MHVQALGLQRAVERLRVRVVSGLRVSEILALRWSDIDQTNSCIRVIRAYVYGRFGPPKSRASRKPVPLHPPLAASLETWRKETPYPTNDDFVFPSFRLKGKKPPRAAPESKTCEHSNDVGSKPHITE